METAFVRSALPNWRIPANLHRLLLASGTILVLLLLGSSLWQATASLRSLDELRQQGERLEHIDGMLIQLMDVEGTVRSYLLSGDRNHLEPYEKGQATIWNTLNTLRRELESSPDNGSVVDDLAGLVGHKLEFLDRLVERGRSGRRAGSKDKDPADGIRERLSELKKSVATESQNSFQRSTFHLDRARRMVTGLALAALALMLVLFVVLERQFQLREQLASMLQSENRRLDSLVHERTEDLSDLASYLTNVREDEKERLARELHDELGALLTAAKIESGRLAERLDDKASAACGQRLARLEEYLDRGIALKQRIIDDLRPPFLEEFGLVETLRILGDDFAQEGDESLIMALPEGKVELAPAATLALFRIAQEALTNVRKHARAKSVTLALETTPDGIRLEIVDDGVGISAKVVRAAQHGLKGMKHRVQMCAGAFSFSSRPGDGTRITVVIPAVAGENGMAPADAGKRMVGKDFDLDIPELAGRSARRYAGSASRASLPIVSGAGLAAL